MIAIDIPGFGALRLQHLVLDYNGTLAADGELLPGVGEALKALAGQMRIHVITADTFGRAAEMLAGLPVDLVIAPATAQAEAKLEFVTALGADEVVAIGNGRNDRRMLEAAALGIAVIQSEGASTESVRCAPVVATSILDALELLQHPQRLVATLRS
jgi:soluble P-type ATPase